MFLINQMLISSDPNQVVKGLELKRRYLESEYKFKQKMTTEGFESSMQYCLELIKDFVPAEKLPEFLNKTNEIRQNFTK
jgi:hypothetical protein